MRHCVEVEVDINDFDDKIILAAAREIGVDNYSFDAVADLAAAIERGDKTEAHILLCRLVDWNSRLADAADLGRRRVS